VYLLSREALDLSAFSSKLRVPEENDACDARLDVLGKRFDGLVLDGSALGVSTANNWD
jgi:hypothetical protein